MRGFAFKRPHSVVDLITNSSTSIYTWFDDAIEPAYDVIQALYDINGIRLDARDVFNIGFLYRYDIYSEFDIFSSRRNIPESVAKIIENEQITDDKQMKELHEKIQSGKVEKPEWMKIVEDCIRLSGCREDYGTQEFYVTSNDPSNAEVVNHLSTLVSSIETESLYG